MKFLFVFYKKDIGVLCNQKWINFKKIKLVVNKGNKMIKRVGVGFLEIRFLFQLGIKR